MNQNQKIILVAVIIIIAGMLAYPPFQVVAKNGTVFNMGYGWIIDPPKRGYITATVNVAMLLIQWVGVLVVGGLAFFLTKKTQQQSNASSSTPWNESLPTDQSSSAPSGDLAENATSEQKNSPAGVGGWLLLLVAGMMVFGPLLGAGRINADIMMAERQYPAITSLDEWGTFKSATWWIYLCVAAISFYGGLGLARGNDWSVVKRAKTILWITGPVALLVLGGLIPTMSFGESNAVDAQFVGAFIGSVIAATIWTAYLSKSKRVRNTYGEKHSEVEKTDRNLLSPKILEYENDDQESSVLCGDDDDIRECPKCGMENRIQKISVGFIQKCDKCGNVDYFKEKEMDETSWENRVLCSDKNCIGVIGKDSRCKICGKKGEVELPRNDRSK
jgi:hypothetical protein